MCVERAHPCFTTSYMSLENWSNSSMESWSLLDASEDEMYYFGHRVRRNHNYLARQIFLRSYQFCLEESFKEKLKKSLRRLKGVAKAVMDGQYETLLARKMKQKMKVWPSACFKPSFGLQKPAAAQQVLGLF
eukprot:Gb_39745 [translate_table: standard]